MQGLSAEVDSARAVALLVHYYIELLQLPAPITFIAETLCFSLKMVFSFLNFVGVMMC